MKINAFPAAMALLFGLGLSAAPPNAVAEVPSMNGVYHYADEDGDVGTWTITTTCNPRCVANVTTAPGHGFEAHLENGRFVTTRVVPDGLECPHVFMNEMWLGGGTHEVVATQSWDPVTLTGEVHFSHTAPPCTLDDQHDRFTLTRIG